MNTSVVAGTRKPGRPKKVDENFNPDFHYRVVDKHPTDNALSDQYAKAIDEGFEVAPDQKEHSRRLMMRIPRDQYEATQREYREEANRRVMKPEKPNIADGDIHDVTDRVTERAASGAELANPNE